MISCSNLHLFSLTFIATSAFARVLIPQIGHSLAPRSRHQVPSPDVRDANQIRILPHRMPLLHSIPPPRTVTGGKYPFDAEENSVGVLFTTSDTTAQDVVHLWLPLGKVVSTRNSPILPLRPLTARVTTFIHTRPELAAPELLDRIQCDVWTYSNRTESTGRTERWKVSFGKKDDVVAFGDEEGPFWLGGKEVESYYCFS